MALPDADTDPPLLTDLPRDCVAVATLLSLLPPPTWRLLPPPATSWPTRRRTRGDSSVWLILGG